MIRLLIFFAFVIAALLGCLVAIKENGATDHPLLVDSACLTFEKHPCARMNCNRRIA